jgi:hypothetical protein
MCIGGIPPGGDPEEGDGADRVGRRVPEVVRGVGYRGLDDLVPVL